MVPFFLLAKLFLTPRYFEVFRSLVSSHSQHALSSSMVIMIRTGSPCRFTMSFLLPYQHMQSFTTLRKSSNADLESETVTLHNADVLDGVTTSDGHIFPNTITSSKKSF